MILSRYVALRRACCAGAANNQRMKTIVILFALLTVFCGKSFAAEKPNVLLIIADYFRDTGGVFTRALVKTPNLDRLAARGTRFANAFAQYPVCNPSRTSLLTGLRCEQTGIVGNQEFFRDKW